MHEIPEVLADQTEVTWGEYYLTDKFFFVANVTEGLGLPDIFMA